MTGAIRRLLATGLLALTGVTAALAAAVPLPADAPVLLNETEFIASDATQPPADGWQPQALPDSWRVSRPGQSGYGWYRIRLSLKQPPTGSLGLLINMVGTTYAVYVNGVDVADGGGMQGEIRRNGGVPQFVLLPPQVFHAGENWLHLRLRVAPNLRGGLTPMLLGPREPVESAFERLYFLRVTLSRSANVALIVTGLLVGVLWLRHPQRSIYGYFAALAILWSVRNFHYTSTGFGLPSRVWEAFVLGSLGVVLMLLWLFLLRLTAQSWPRAERVLPWVCLGVPLLFFALGEQAMSQLRLGWYGVCVLLGLAAMAVPLRHLRNPDAPRQPGLWLILAAMGLTLAFGLHDYAISANLVPWGSAALMAFGAPLLLAALVFALADRYFGAIDAVGRLNATLEQRIQERTQELSQTYERMTDLQRAAAVAQERERLMRDIHDGVGSQLITAKSGIEKGGLSQRDAAALIGQCIADLRLVIDSLDPEQRHAGDALATLRWRIQPKLAEAGIESVWEIAETPLAMPPGELLDLVRIVQEALTNVLKHAGASTVEVAFEARPGGGWRLRVCDNGRGFDPEAAARGRGLGNMRRRAERLGAQLQTGPGTDGRGSQIEVRRA